MRAFHAALAPAATALLGAAPLALDYLGFDAMVPTELLRLGWVLLVGLLWTACPRPAAEARSNWLLLAAFLSLGALAYRVDEALGSSAERLVWLALHGGAAILLWGALATWAGRSSRVRRTYGVAFWIFFPGLALLAVGLNWAGATEIGLERRSAQLSWERLAPCVELWHRSIRGPVATSFAPFVAWSLSALVCGVAGGRKSFSGIGRSEGA